MPISRLLERKGLLTELALEIVPTMFYHMVFEFLFSFKDLSALYALFEIFINSASENNIVIFESLINAMSNMQMELILNFFGKFFATVVDLALEHLPTILILHNRLEYLINGWW